MLTHVDCDINVQHLFSQPSTPSENIFYARFQHQGVGVQGAAATIYFLIYFTDLNRTYRTKRETSLFVVLLHPPPLLPPSLKMGDGGGVPFVNTPSTPSSLETRDRGVVSFVNTTTNPFLARNTMKYLCCE